MLVCSLACLLGGVGLIARHECCLLVIVLGFELLTLFRGPTQETVLAVSYVNR